MSSRSYSVSLDSSNDEASFEEDYLDSMLDFVHGIEQRKAAAPLLNMTPISVGTFASMSECQSGVCSPSQYRSGPIKNSFKEAKTPVVAKKTLCTGVSSPTDVRDVPQSNPIANYIVNTSPLLEELRQQDQLYDGSSISSAEEELRLDNSFLNDNPYVINVPNESERISPFGFHDAVDCDPIDVEYETTQRFHDSFELIEDIEKNFPTVQRTVDFPSFSFEPSTELKSPSFEQNELSQFEFDFGGLPDFNKEFQQPSWSFCRMQTKLFDGLRKRLRTNRRYFSLVHAEEDSFAENERVSL